MLHGTTRLLAFAFFATIALNAEVAGQQLAPLKIGYTDHEILISNLPDYQSVQAQLQSELEQNQAELQIMAQDFQTQVETYQKRQPLLSQTTRAEREAELAQVQQDLQEKAMAMEQNLAETEAELLSPLFERVDAAIKKIAAEKGLDLVLRIQAGPTQPIILYANEDRILDITLDVAIEIGIDVGEGN